MKILILIIIFIGGSLLFIYPISSPPVHVIAVHHSDGITDILVNDLPHSQQKAIAWWQSNRRTILAEYQIPAIDNGNFNSVSFFRFGKAYQELEKKDRLCFEDMAPPRNCIDKLLLMSVSVTRERNFLYRFQQGVYIETPDGKVIKKEQH